MTCTFFGHKDTPDAIEPILKDTLIKLIEENSVSTFYVGNHGNFDSMVARILKELKTTYDIDYSIVLAYLPSNSDNNDYGNTLYPEGLENIPLRFSINYRNTWMVDSADYVVCYVTTSFGGAYKYKTLAINRGKVVINLSEIL